MYVSARLINVVQFLTKKVNVHCKHSLNEYR